MLETVTGLLSAADGSAKLAVVNTLNASLPKRLSVVVTVALVLPSKALLTPARLTDNTAGLIVLLVLSTYVML